MLLIYPPIAKASEPPCGIALLAGALKSHRIPCQVIDMNLGAQEYILEDYFKKHPKKAHYRNLIRKMETYGQAHTYIRAINELSRGLDSQNGTSISLSNYSDPLLDPLDSSDLIQAAKDYRDSPFFPYYQHCLSTLLASGKIEHIGISLQFINQALATFSLIGYIKDHYPGIKIILGGGLINSWSSLEKWNNPFSSLVDKIITGPGEEKLLETLGIQPDPEKLKHNRPDYSWALTRPYYSPGLILPVSASQGCSWRRCKFCPELAQQSRYIPQKNSHVLDWMKEQEATVKPALFHFMDNEISPGLLKALAQSGLKTPWYGFTKFYPRLKDPDFCRQLKESGCSMLKLGLESGDQSIIDSLDKGIRLEDVIPILSNLKEAGIKSFIYILFGTPVENLESARKTLVFIDENAENIHFLNVAIYNQPIHNREFEIQDRFQYSKADLSLYTGFDHPLGWNRGAIRKFLKDEFQQSRKIKEILGRTPPQFGANHGAFCN